MPTVSNPFPEVAAFFKSVGASSSAPASVVVGVSGGADSVALLHILYRYRADFGIGRLVAAHVNHGLRGAESDEDEAFVRGEAEGLGVEFACVRLNYCGGVNLAAGTDTGDLGYSGDMGMDVDDSGGVARGSGAGGGGVCPPSVIVGHPPGIEAWARLERYKFFSSLRVERGFDWVATAHTASDQAETVLMRLARGAGLRGLRGILPVRGDGVIRPLLGVERCRLLDWLSALGVGYRVDSSNADLRFRRNRIRAEVVPGLAECDPAAVRNIAAAAAAARAAWAAVEGRVAAWVGEYVCMVSPEIFHIEKAGLAGGSVAGGVELAREALLVLFDRYGIPPSRLHIERAGAALEGKLPVGGKYLLPGGWAFYCRDDRVCFVKTE
jgi:tRNA(Ile)-lysidine synthase